MRADNFSNTSYIKHESNCERNKTVTITEYLEEIKPYLKDMVSKS